MAGKNGGNKRGKRGLEEIAKDFIDCTYVDEGDNDDCVTKSKRVEDFHNFLDSLVVNKNECRKIIGNISWSTIAGNALKNNRFEIIEEITDLLYGRTERRERLYEANGKRIVEGKERENRNKKWHEEGERCSIRLNLGVLISGLAGLKDKSQIKRFFYLEDSFNFGQKNGVESVNKILQKLIESEDVDEGMKELLLFLREKDVYKNFKGIFEKENFISFLDNASESMLECLMVDCDILGEYLHESGTNLEKNKTKLVIKKMEKLLEDSVDKEDWSKFKIWCKVPGIDKDEIKASLKNNFKNIKKVLKDRMKKEDIEKYLKDLSDVLKVSNQKNDVVRVDDYIEAIKNDGNVLDIFNKFGTEGNPRKEDGIIILFAAIIEYKQQDKEKMNRCYEIFKEELNSIGEQENWEEIISNVLLLEDVEIFDNFWKILKGKSDIKKININWNKILQMVDCIEDTDCRIDMLDVLIHKTKSVLGVNWEKELVNIYKEGNTSMASYVFNKCEDKFDKVLLIKEAISAKDSDLLDTVVDECNNTKEFSNTLRSVLPYAYDRSVDVFGNLVVKYGNDDIRAELFKALYTNEQEEGWTSFLSEVDEKRVTKLREYFLCDASRLMYICGNTIDLKSLEQYHNLDEKKLVAGDLMFEASKKGDLDLIKHLLSRIDADKLDGKWIKQLELIGDKELYNNVIRHVCDKRIRLLLSDEVYLRASGYIREKIGKEKLECVTYDTEKVKSVNDVVTMVRGRRKKITPGLLKSMRTMSQNKY